ncbi:MAG: glycosyltransferase [Sandaracinaceae bacterium]|nr:glycosyltransferase [Sandaracinaceae bacterium]
MREAVKKAGLEDVVEVRGEPSDAAVPALIAAADVCLAPCSDGDAAGLRQLPQPLLEYLACYRPVIAANVAGLSELVRDDVEGLLYPPGDAGPSPTRCWRRCATRRCASASWRRATGARATS